MAPTSIDPDHHGHGHGAGRGHQHGHHHDRGARAIFRYLRLLPVMWRSDVNEAVVAELAIKPGERVVDLGAGVGPASVAAARLGAEVIAVDPMPFMRAVLGLRRLVQGHIRVMDGAAESIPVADGSIDALWSVNTLHHWTDREKAARELARVLKPGGRALLLDEDFTDPAHPHFDHARAERHRSNLVFDEVDPKELATALTTAGFARAEALRTTFARHPVKLIRATR